MNIKKCHLTRKHKTLAYALVFVLCLALVLTSHTIHLTPMDTIQDAERKAGLEPTEIVIQEGDLYLSESETALMLSRHSPWVRNWNQAPPVVIWDKSKVAPAYMTYWLIKDTANEVITLHLVGEVLMKEAVSVRAYYPEELGSSLYTTELSCPILTGDNGNHYIWLTQDIPYRTNETFVVPHCLDILDENGTILYTVSHIGTTTETIQ